MTRFDNPATGVLEGRARALLSHVEAAAEREALPYPAEAQGLAQVLKHLDLGRSPNPDWPF